MGAVFFLLAACGARSALDPVPVEADPQPCDADGDGHAPPSCGGLDCNDCDPAVRPDADDPLEGRWAVDTLPTVDGLPGRWLSLEVGDDGVPRVALTASRRLFVGEIQGTTLDTADVASSGRSAALAQGEDGTLHVSYEGELGGLHYAHEGDDAFEVETVDEDPAAGRYSDVLVQAGVVHVVYSFWRFRVGYALLHATKTDAGWAVETVDDEMDTGFNPSLAFDPDGRLHVAYCRYVDGEPGAVVHGVLEASGWRLDLADQGSQVGAQPSLAIDAAGDPHVTYYAFDPADEEHQGLFHAELEDEAWARERIDAGRNVGYFNGLAASACALDVAYTGAEGEVRYATDRSGVWLAEEIDPTNGTYVSFDVAPDGEAHVVFRPGTGSILHAARSVVGGIDQDCDGEDG